MAHSGGYNGCMIILRHLLVSTVQNSFIAGILCDTGLEIVRNQQTGYTTKVVIGVHVAADPVLQLHVVAGFRIGEAAAGQDSHKQICFAHLASDWIMDIQRISCPVHLHSVTGLVLDPHGCFRHSGPLAVFLTILGVHIGHCALGAALAAVFLPENSQICAFPSQLCVDVRIVRNDIERRFLVFLWEQQFHEHFVGHGIRQWPGDSGLLSRLLDLTDRVMRAAQFQFHGAYALIRVAADPQDVSVVEQMNFLLDKCHTLSCADTIIEKIPKCGCPRDGVAVFP